MAELAKRLSNEERLSALLRVLSTEEPVPSSEAWPESVSARMRVVFLRDLQPFLNVERPSRTSDALYEISPTLRAPLQQFMISLENLVAAIDDED